LEITVFQTIQQTQSWVLENRQRGACIAFVPTMGALHAGHISLIQLARKRADVVISSIFVNPTQFNNPNDLLKYPRTLEKDIEMLQNGGCNALFAPNVEEIYPKLQKGHWDFGSLSSRLEGHYRPGHFDGVCTVVKKLFEIVTPDIAFFGEKDFQQLAIIRQLVQHEKMDIEIVGCPTMREHDGLAMSSRNMRLNAAEREQALAISKVLFFLKENKNLHSPAKLEKIGRTMLQEAPGLRTEYLQIVDGDTFEDITDWNVQRPVALFAGYVGEVRLIDNILL
jgi:pantoate--beta-alanine ligase